MNLEEYLNILKEKIKQYERYRNTLYSMIDLVHNSPNNIQTFKELEEIYIRLDELYQIVYNKSGSQNSRNDNNKNYYQQNKNFI